MLLSRSWETLTQHDKAVSTNIRFIHVRGVTRCPNLNAAKSRDPLRLRRRLFLLLRKDARYLRPQDAQFAINQASQRRFSLRFTWLKLTPTADFPAIHESAVKDRWRMAMHDFGALMSQSFEMARALCRGSPCWNRLQKNSHTSCLVPKPPMQLEYNQTSRQKPLTQQQEEKCKQRQGQHRSAMIAIKQSSDSEKYLYHRNTT